MLHNKEISEQPTAKKPQSRVEQVVQDVKRGLRGLMAAVVASRYEPGFLQYAKEETLKHLGYRLNEYGDLVKIEDEN